MQIPAHDVAIMQKIVAKLKILSKHRDDEETTESNMRRRESHEGQVFKKDSE